MPKNKMIQQIKIEENSIKTQKQFQHTTRTPKHLIFG